MVSSSVSSSTGAAGEAFPLESLLPDVSDAQATAAREEVLHRKFSPAGNRPPQELLPQFEVLDRLPIIDQGMEGVSVGVGLAALLNYLRARSGETAPVSPRMLYEYARLYDEWPGRDYEGSSLWGAVAGLMRHGVCLEQDWPLSGAAREPAQWSAPIKPFAVQRVDTSIEQLQAAVFEHHAIVVCGQVHDGWGEPKKGLIPFDGTQPVNGGHAFAVLGYTEQGFIIQNSWGRQWGGIKQGRRTWAGLAIWSYADAAANISDAWVVQLSRNVYRAPLVGYDADSLDGDDLMEIKAEVNAFSYVLASNAIRPPLAVGLFGDWGSGKSFFMKEMQAKIGLLATLPPKGAEGTPSSAFCRRIVQIKFNAWHYLDTDLWASLVTEIFDRLFECIGGQTGRPEEKLPQLACELQSANGVYQQAQQQLQDAVVSRTSAEAALAAAVTARKAKEQTLLAQVDDLAELVKESPAVEAQVGQLAGALGVPELKESFQALDTRASELKSLSGRAVALVQLMFSAPGGWLRMATLVAALLAPVLAVVVLEALRRRLGLELASAQSLAVQLSSLLAAMAAWLGTVLKRGSGLLAALEDTHRKLEALRARRHALAVATEEGALRALQDKEEAARASMQEAERRVQQLQREIDDLQPGRLITRFIEERTRSADYRTRLGIVSLVRRDFQRLSELADPLSDKHDAELMPVERIILYIDDLDRCKPERVIEVLEAVHLLLAFRLFMVVVAVDPRWLRHCLEKHYPDLLTMRAGAPAGVGPSRPATAQDYLEKIFQIPFTLQPLKDDGFRRLIRGLTELNLAADTGAPIAAHPSAAGASVASAAPGGGAGASRVGAGGDAIKAQARQAARAQTQAEDTAESEESAIEHLRMRAWELEDMERLAPLFQTPRAVKRFVNTYRFLRAGVRPQYQARFEGERGQPGTYRGALSLLAIVVGYSNVAPRFLRRVRDHAERGASSQDWSAFLREARADSGDGTPAAGPPGPAVAGSWEQAEWAQLCDALLRVSRDGFPVRRVGELEEWLSTVSRFSFSLSAAPEATPTPARR